MKKIRLIDVALHAGVSKSTVSQYLNGRFDYMSKDTKARIQSAISELNYVPNPIARSLKTSKTRTIGVVVRDITGYYTSSAIRGIDDFCKSGEYNIIIYNTDFEPDTEARALRALSQLRVDGIIIAPSGKNASLVSTLGAEGLPIVHFQLEHDGSEENIVLSDYKEAAFNATEYLLQLGHERICFMTQEFDDTKSRKDRYLGYVAALEKYGHRVDDQLVQHWDRETGFQQSPGRILESSNAPTAIFTQHLAITTDLLKEFARDNIVIPDDVSLVGFDDIPMVEFFKVPVTVVRQEPYEVGKEAARVILDQIGNKRNVPKRVLIPCTLVERQSCKTVSAQFSKDSKIADTDEKV